MQTNRRAQRPQNDGGPRETVMTSTEHHQGRMQQERGAIAPRIGGRHRICGGDPPPSRRLLLRLGKKKG